MSVFESQVNVDALRREYPTGTKVVVDAMEDPFPTPVGTAGTVKFVDDAGQIQVVWENGSQLALIPGVDRFHKIP